MNLHDLHKELSKFDWGYHMSDDNRVYMAGRTKWDDLKVMGRDIDGGPEMIVAFQHWADGKAEKPIRPEHPDVTEFVKRFDAVLADTTSEEFAELFQLTPEDLINQTLLPYFFHEKPFGFENGGCLYLTWDGARCAVGRWLISPESANPDDMLAVILGCNQINLVPEVRGILSNDAWAKVQAIHDLAARLENNPSNEYESIAIKTEIDRLEDVCGIDCLVDLRIAAKQFIRGKIQNGIT